ncbi:MAG TPA: glycosyltransferase [Acidimicrobiales bacterium]|nr:glycosyltransferase [Acidimicrobiales bacterium]
MPRILIVTADVLRPAMAGPAMRAWHLAQQLAAQLGGDGEVRLVTTSAYCEVLGEGFEVGQVGAEGLAAAEEWCDVMVLQGYITHHFPQLAESSKVIVFDVYDPLHLETLALTKGHSGQARDDHVRLSIEVLNSQLRRGDFFICASERQRDLFVGQLCALGRANALTYDPDPTLRRLIDVVPFGLPDEPPRHERPALRGVVPGIGGDDDVLIWAGGVYDWFDPLTLIRAVALVAGRRPSVRLFFMGLRHPNPDVPEMKMAGDARALATELGLAGKHVFFNEGWVGYSERQNYLLEATLGVTMHFESAETDFSFRTRALDYLWTGLPMVSTKGDSFARLVEDKGLGATVAPQDPEALASALLELLEDPEELAACRQRVQRKAEAFRWSKVVAPLADFCRSPRHALDYGRGPSGAEPLRAALTEPEPATPRGALELSAARAQRAIDLVAHHYRQGGVAQVVKQGARKTGRAARQVREKRKRQ